VSERSGAQQGQGGQYFAHERTKVVDPAGFALDDQHRDGERGEVLFILETPGQPPFSKSLDQSAIHE